jgi:hypothetical protein
LSRVETHIVMSSLIFHLVLILMFCLAITLVLRLSLFHGLCLSSLMDLTIAHMVLVHERTALSLDALVTAHVLVVVIVSHVCLIFLIEGPSSTLSRDTWTVHVFSVVGHVPLGLVVGHVPSLARVSQSGLKTGGGATTGGARGSITEIASEAS